MREAQVREWACEHDERTRKDAALADGWCPVCLAGELAEVRRALRLLVADVQDYEAWQRPCHALEVAKAALALPDRGA